MSKKKSEKEKTVERQDRILRLEREKNRIIAMKQNFEKYYLSEIIPRYYKIKKGKCKKCSNQGKIFYYFGKMMCQDCIIQEEISLK